MTRRDFVDLEILEGVALKGIACSFFLFSLLLS